MKLKRLRIENFKRFRAPLELGDFADGLNLFVAPNEAGKSTVAEAIRAAFFERYKSSSVSGLRPWSDSSATPSVDIEFELGGKSARLSKAFLSKKRCQLSIDGRVLDGTEAEDHLGELLGFSFAGRGGTSPEHMGIPGLLWIKQGTSHELAKAVGFASDHLRNALGESLGELASTSGDDVIKAVETERNQLLTPSTDSPRGVYAESLKRHSALEQELEVLRARSKRTGPLSIAWRTYAAIMSEMAKHDPGWPSVSSSYRLRSSWTTPPGWPTDGRRRSCCSNRPPVRSWPCVSSSNSWSATRRR